MKQRRKKQARSTYGLKSSRTEEEKNSIQEADNLAVNSPGWDPKDDGRVSLAATALESGGREVNERLRGQMQKGPSAAVSVLADEVMQLKELFMQRLLANKAELPSIAAAQEGLITAVAEMRQHDQMKLAGDIREVAKSLRSAEPTSEEAKRISEALLAKLLTWDVTPVSASVDFDARVHEIVGTISESESIARGTILSVERPGYMLAGRLLRPSQVIVSTVDEGDASVSLDHS